MTHLHISVPAITRGTLARTHELKNDTNSKHEESRGVKEKGEELRCGLGRGALSLPVPEGFLSLTLAFPVLLVPTTVEPLH